MIAFPPKKIVLAVDLAEPHRGALAMADELRRRFGCSIEAAYVETPEGALLPEPERHILRGTLRDRLGRRSGRGRVLEAGRPSARLLALLRASKPDLVVMGTHGLRGVKRLIAGSVAEETVAGSPSPVLVVPRRAGPPRSVLAPLALDVDSYRALKAAATVAVAWSARLTALHVATTDYEASLARLRLDRLIRALPERLSKAARPKVEVTVGRKLKTLAEVSRRYGLVIVTVRRHLGTTAFGTTAEHLVRRSATPVLCVPEKHL